MKSIHNVGFTLVEVLVVVVIIAVLAAVAVPQYQKAVLKSRFSSLMPTTKAVHDGNEAYFMAHGGYASAVNQLDVTATNNEDMTFEISRDPDYSYVLATRPNLENNLIMYQKHSAQFPGEIHCEALADDTKANWLCEKGMHAIKTLGEGITSGYIEYVIEGEGTGLTPAEMDAMNGPNCDKALSMGYTCSITQNEDGSTTKQVCHARGVCSIYNYNEDGSYKRTTCQLNNSNVCVSKVEFFYDENGNLLARRQCNNADANGKCTAYGRGNEYVYDENGNMISQRECYQANVTTNKCTSYASGGSDYIYDANGNKIASRGCASVNVTTGACTYTSYGTYNYTYDANGNMTSERHCASVDEATGKCTVYKDDTSSNLDYTYDANGNMIYQRTCATVNADTGVCTGYSTTAGPRGTFEYYYDANGNKENENINSLHTALKETGIHLSSSDIGLYCC